MDGGSNGSGNRNKNREEGGGEREYGNLRHDSRGGSTPKTNQQPQLEDPTSWRDHCIVQRASAQKREARDMIREGGGGVRSASSPRRVSGRR